MDFLLKRNLFSNFEPVKQYVMKRIIILSFIIVTFFTCCKNDSRTYVYLAQIDSLLTKEENDAALERLMTMDVNKITDNEDRAYYYLLRTETFYRLQLPTYSNTAINASIKYYRQSSDRRNLARALYYKGMMASENSNASEAIKYVKEAETIAERTNNSTLQNYIYANLASINSRIGNNQTALSYAKKSLHLSKERGDKSMICLSFERISNAFAELEQHDSTLFYAIKAIPYIKYLTKEEKVSALANVASSYFNQGHMDKAEHYIRQSLAVEPTAYAYYILGSIYLEQGKGAQAEALWGKAISTGSPEVRAEAMLWMADLKKGGGQYREATELMAKAEALSDSISRAKETEGTLRLQAAMEHAEAERNAEGRLTAAAILAVAIAAVLATLAVYLRRKANMTKHRLAEMQELTDKYGQEISRLSLSKAENEKRISSLNRKMETLRSRRAAIIGRGRQRYEEIKGGGTVAGWRKEDYEAAIEYYRTVNPEAVDRIENRHKRLTPYNTFCLLLPHIGIADDDIPHAMNMSVGAARTMKYRLKGDDAAQA